MNALYLALAFQVAEPPKAKITVGPETTIVNGPLDENGFVDFAKALNEKMRGQIKPEQNANVLLWKINGPVIDKMTLPDRYFEELGMPLLPEKGKYWKSFGEIFPNPLGEEREKFWSNQTEATKRPWKKDDFPGLAQWLAANEEHLPLVIEASKRTEYFNPLVPKPEKNGQPAYLIGALLPNVQRAREFASMLAMRAMRNVEEKQFDAAWEDAMAIHRLGRLLSRGGTLIEGLVGLALDAVAMDVSLSVVENSSWSAAEIAKRWQEVQALPPLASMAEKVDVAERFVFLDAIQNIARGGGFKFQGIEIPGNVVWDISAMMKVGNPWYDRLSKTMKMTDRQPRVDEFLQIEKELKEINKNSELGVIWSFIAPERRNKMMANRLVGLLMPAAQKVSDAVDRNTQRRRMQEIAFALEAHKRDQQTNPDSLAALSPKYVKVVPIDLFNNQPLKYQRTEKGYILYSVGVNGKDDQGRGFDDKPRGDDMTLTRPLPKLTP